MRCLVLCCVVLLACAKAEPPVQEPRDYLRVGVDPKQEASTIIQDLRRHGYEIRRRIDETGYVAFDAASGGVATVRVVTSRGVALSVDALDVRWPERLWGELASDPRPDFDRDGQHDVVVAMRERDRTCLAWAEVDRQGFAKEVFRPRTDWGDAPCVLEIDPARPRLLLEVGVPGVAGVRVRVPVMADAGTWVFDDSAAGRPRWEQEISQREQALEVREMQGDEPSAARLRAELAWLEQLRNAPGHVLEPADDGEEAR